jgi:serine/threonine protein kinase
MSTPKRLSELLLHWRELQQQGKQVSPEEVCADCPELTDELKRRIEAIHAMEALLKDGVNDSSSTTAADERPKRLPGTVAESATKDIDLDKIRIPGYEVVGVIDRGGMGVVYKAVQTRLKRSVALKMILAGPHAGPQQLDRFRTEAQAIARLQHPNIIQIYEVGESEGRPFFTMELVEGGTLAQHLEDFRLPASNSVTGSSNSKIAVRKERDDRVARIVNLMETLADTIHTAHQRGIVHRDLKPANVLLTPEGLPKITDFGLAKRLDAASKHTNTGAILGTPSYMAPEQASGRPGNIGPATDVYALGAILYELLTGRPPFQGETSLETLMGVMSQDPVPPSQYQRGVPRDLEAICLKCLEKKPAHRYASAADLADDLRRFRQDQPIARQRFRRLRRATRWLKRHMLLSVTIALSVVALAAVFAIRHRQQRPDPRAEAERLTPQVRQILHHYCFECHGMDPNHVERKLNVLDHASLLDPKRRMIVPGQPERSRLIQRIVDESMPPQKYEELPRISLEEQQILKAWIVGGAPAFKEIMEEDLKPPPVVDSPLAARVKQLFTEKCRACHNPDEAGGGIKILNHDMLVNKRGVVIPNDPANSELFRLISYDLEPVMPPREKNGKENRLSSADVELVREWIEAGAPAFPRSKREE